MTGHWELMGLHIDKPFRVFPEGFPDDLINQIEHPQKIEYYAKYDTVGRCQHIHKAKVLVGKENSPVFAHAKADHRLVPAQSLGGQS